MAIFVRTSYLGSLGMIHLTPAMGNHSLTRPRRLPTELVDSVFMHLRPGLAWTESWPQIMLRKWALSSCALVCRAWHAIVRSHLFHDISYSFKTHTKRDKSAGYSSTVFGGGWNGSPRKFPRKSVFMLYSFLSAHPGIAMCVRQLKLEAWPVIEQGISSDEFSDDSDDEDDMDWDDEDNLDPEFFLSLLKLCPRLLDLSLSNVFINAAPSLHSSRILQSLSTLSIATKRADVYKAHVAALFACFSRVDSVRLALPQDRGDEHGPGPTLNGTLQINTRFLDLGAMVDDDFIVNLRSSPTVHRLATLRIGFLDAGIYTVIELQKLLKDAAKTLTALDVAVDSDSEIVPGAHRYVLKIIYRCSCAIKKRHC